MIARARGGRIAAATAAAALLFGAGGQTPPPAKPAANPSAGAPAAPAPNLHGATLTYVPADQIFPAVDAEVLGAQGEKMGRIVEVLVDDQGRPRAAVIDFGGFLGVGSRKIAIEWSALQFGIGANKQQVITLALGRDQLAPAPAYKPDDDKPLPVVTPPKPPLAKTLTGHGR